MLGTNGGGFFNVNSAHPFENPTGFTNLLEMLAVLVIPAALIFTYGKMAGNRRQGYAIYSTVMIMFLGACVVAYIAEAHGSPAQHAAGLHTAVINGSTGGLTCCAVGASPCGSLSSAPCLAPSSQGCFSQRLPRRLKSISQQVASQARSVR